jgi:tetratricopeptide (TPR) repeat protein
MAKQNWIDLFGWDTEVINNIRFVGAAYAQQGKFDIALDFFKMLVLLNPKQTYDLQMLGAIYLQIGKGLESLEYLDRSLKIDPNHLPTILNRAKALFSIGYKKQGLLQAKVLERCPNNKIASQAMALIQSHS